jgi:cytochrome c oxidase accessory protein FixG
MVHHDLYEYDEEFRDSIGTVDKEGKRVWVYPKKPTGRLHAARVWVSVGLLAILFAGPFIKIGGQPLLLLNIFERKFVIFGVAFWPQDFFLVALLAVTFFVFIILFTVVFGRIWCGWACPQTLFMEMVFRKIEYWIEGDANQQRKLNHMPWTAEKVLKKGSKQAIFLFISILISHTVMAYLIGIEQVRDVVSRPPSENMAGFLGLVAFTGIFYWVFAWFREQACVAVCPYGRLQGVLLVKDSIAVMYDWLRGEPRGKLKKGEIDTSKGDCIDCKLCVHVCPTGIDIRHGTQLECVNCTACIDACDEVMIKIGKPTGLIRYSSFNAIKDGVKKLFTPRVAGYSVVLLALVSVLVFMMATRSPVETTILRVSGTSYQMDSTGMISNIFNLNIVNKSFEEMQITLRLEDLPGATVAVAGGDVITLPPNGYYKGVLIMKMPNTHLEQTSIKVRMGLYHHAQKIESISTRFAGPIKRPKK